MRVIAGIHKGRKLMAPATDDTRPVTDRVKESIFSSLGGVVVAAAVVDLYAGAGSFGIEAASRGAGSVTFVERAPRALAALATNLKSLGIEATVLEIPVERYRPAGPIDLLFCDPPWSMPSSELGALIERLGPAVVPGGLVVITRRAGDPVPLPYGFEIDDDRRMGDTRIVRYRKEDG